MKIIRDAMRPHCVFTNLKIFSIKKFLFRKFLLQLAPSIDTHAKYTEYYNASM